MSKLQPTVGRRRAPSSADGALYSISQLARMAEESDHVIRYYCRIGLLEPAQRNANGYRRFGPRSLKHLRFIRLAQGLGFSLAEIAEVIRHARKGASPCPDVRAIVSKRLAHVAEQLQALITMHQRMRHAFALWQLLPDRTPSGDEICHLIEMDFSASELTQP